MGEGGERGRGGGVNHWGLGLGMGKEGGGERRGEERMIDGWGWEMVVRGWRPGGEGGGRRVEGGGGRVVGRVRRSDGWRVFEMG